jgi:predicted nucleic acid-binding protein
MLDSSVLIAAERGTLRLEKLLAQAAGDSIAVSAITASELLHGYHRANLAGVRAKRAAFVEGLLDAIPVLPFGLAEARRHAELWAALLEAGTALGPHDLLIAATALTHGMTLATLNHREFNRVPGLRLVPMKAFLD